MLLDALPKIFEKYPNALVQFAGPYQNIIGEELYFQRLMPRIEQYQKDGRWRFMGTLDPEHMAMYYPNLDVLVLPSLNSTEAFGLVQIEAMMNGVPCVASNLPGVRQPVKIHGMGKVVPIGDSAALADAVLDIFAHPADFHRDPAEITQRYLPETIVMEYEKLFKNLFARLGKTPPRH